MYDECPICYECYDLHKHSPRIISCGHTICSKCINNLIYFEVSHILKCPLDKTAILLKKRKASCFPKNLVFIQMIENMTSTKFCMKHKRKLEWLCQNENTELCAKCLVLEGHRDHEIASVQPNKDDCISNMEKEGLQKKMNKIISACDQPEILVNGNLYEKVQFIKQSFLRLIGLALALLLLLHPFLKFL